MKTILKKTKQKPHTQFFTSNEYDPTYFFKILSSFLKGPIHKRLTRNRGQPGKNIYIGHLFREIPDVATPQNTVFNAWCPLLLTHSEPFYWQPGSYADPTIIKRCLCCIHHFYSLIFDSSFPNRSSVWSQETLKSKRANHISVTYAGRTNSKQHDQHNQHNPSRQSAVYCTYIGKTTPEYNTRTARRSSSTRHILQNIIQHFKKNVKHYSSTPHCDIPRIIL